MLMPKAREQSANCGQGVGVRLPLSSEVSIHKTVEVRVGHGWRGALVRVAVDVPLHHLRAEGRYKAIWKMGIQSSLAQGQSTKVMLMIKWIRTSRLWLSIKSSLSLSALTPAVASQGHLTYKKTHPPLGPPITLRIGLQKCPRERRFLMGEVPL